MAVVADLTVQINRIVPDSYVDGPGRRVAVFFQGCAIGCRGCQNRALWSHAGGEVVAVADLAARLLAECDKAGPSTSPFVKLRKHLRTGHRNITISGGEPFEQPAALAALTRRLKSAGAHLIVYTGNVYEALVQNPATAEALADIDILVDGPYIIGQDSSTMQYRGSRNQRPIDLAATRREGRVVTLDWDRPELIITHDGRILASGPLADVLAGWGLGEAVSGRRCGQTS
ncbi:MAG: hypothetical protein FOGNACKC_06103 [Anaerolineae bacterium]|nr:hypothetical protein [Anaerolineae bacterium]